MATLDLKTGGMHCSSCSMLIEMTVGDLPGVLLAKAGYAKGTAHVEFDASAVSAEEIMTAIRDAGYTAEIAA